MQTLTHKSIIRYNGIQLGNPDANNSLLFRKYIEEQIAIKLTYQFWKLFVKDNLHCNRGYSVFSL